MPDSPFADSPYGQEPNEADLEELRGIQAQIPESQDKRLHELVRVKRMINDLEAQLEPKRKLFETLKIALIAQMKAAGLKSQKTTDGSLITITERHMYAANDADKRLFARQFGQEAALTIHFQTFSKIVSELAETEGFTIPGYVKETVIENLQVRLK
jgi:flagellar motor protein MotB